MKKILLPLIILTSIPLFSKIEVLDRVAIIVDDGIVMESQIKNNLEEMITRYDDQNIPKPDCLLYTSPSPRDVEESRMPSSA